MLPEADPRPSTWDMLGNHDDNLLCRKREEEEEAKPVTRTLEAQYG